MTHSHKFGFLKSDFCCLIVVMNGLLLVPPLVNASNLVLWMKEEKQTCPDSESLLSSLFRSKKPACRLKDIMSVCGHSQI